MFPSSLVASCSKASSFSDNEVSMFLKDSSQFDKDTLDFLFFRSDGTGTKLSDSFIKSVGFHARQSSHRETSDVKL